MVRLTRVQQQARTRSAVLEAARAEFREHGYADATVDRIAGRAELTRGAVYSNFPSKRSLYLAVLLEAARPAGPGEPARTGPTTTAAPRSAARPGPAETAEAFARAWLERLALAGDTPTDGRLRSQSLTGVFDDEPGRTATAGLTGLEALLLGLAMEERGGPRRVRLAELILTMLHGAGELARSAPGFGDPFDVVRACRHLAGMDVTDAWDPPYLPFVAPAGRCHDPWTPPGGLIDALTGRAPELGGDRLVVVLGSARLGAAEEAVRATASGVPGKPVIALVTADRAETGALLRLRLAELTRCLAGPYPVCLILDETAALSTAIGARDDGENTESAVRVEGGAIVARAHGRGAAHAVVAPA